MKVDIMDNSKEQKKKNAFQQINQNSENDKKPEKF